MSSPNGNHSPGTRWYSFLAILLLGATALAARAFNLQIMESDFLQGQGEARFLREIEVPVRRGNILDRNGEPLAVSTPVDSVWVNPGELLQSPEDIEKLAELLDADAEEVSHRLTQRAQREFVWLKRRLHPNLAADIAASVDSRFSHSSSIVMRVSTTSFTRS